MKSPFKKLYKKALDTTFSKEELKNSTRISKSATPKYTTDWYVKWVASAFVLVQCHYEVFQSIKKWI